VSLSLSRFCAQHLSEPKSSCALPTSHHHQQKPPRQQRDDRPWFLSHARLIDFAKLKPHSPAPPETDHQRVISVRQRCAGLDVGRPRFTIKEQHLVR
jgi:hypothetical protein